MDWLGNVNELQFLHPFARGVIIVCASVVCGTLIGLEREKRDKPAGLRTVILICVGSTIFTMVSLLVSTTAISDPARIASQVAPGIGFLGAGAIIQARGTIRGLTTGATIWAVAAVGVAVGSGYVAAGLGFTIVIFLTLTVVHNLERLVVGPRLALSIVVRFRPDRGKTRARLLYIFDEFEVPDQHVSRLEADDQGLEGMSIEPRLYRRDHRVFLQRLADLPGVEALEY